MYGATLGSLTLGIVKSLTPSYASRIGDIEVPMGRGSGVQVLGSHPITFSLKGYTSGASRHENLQQIDRYRMIGASLKLTSNEATIPVFIRAIGIDDIQHNSIDYTLSLEGALFKQAEACDVDTAWTVDLGGGALTEATATPTPREGVACLKLSGAPVAAHVESRLKCTPADAIDLSYKDWIAFDYITDNITDMSLCRAVFYHSAGIYATYDFHALVTAINTWYRILIPKTSFVETGGSMEWDAVTYFTIAQHHTSEQTYYFAVDDVGAYE